MNSDVVCGNPFLLGINMLVYSLVLICSYVAVVNSGAHFKRKPLPDYIKACSVTSADFSKCVIKNANQAIPTLVKGDPKYKLATLTPLHIDKLELKPTGGLTLNLQNIKLWGFDTFEVVGAEFDHKKRHIDLNFTARSLKLVSNYDINGQILLLPITGKGESTFLFDDDSAEYSCDYDLLTRADGKTYIDNIRTRVHFDVDKPYYKFENLFNGNKQLGDATNQALNDSPLEVLDVFKEAMTQILKAIIDRVVKAYLTLVPYDELLLE